MDKTRPQMKIRHRRSAIQIRMVPLKETDKNQSEPVKISTNWEIERRVYIKTLGCKYKKCDPNWLE